MTEENKIISLKGIFKRFGYGDAEKYALDDINFEVEAGEFVMIMGQSGCGKTTLLNILGLLDKPTGGSYELNGEKMEKASGAKRAKYRAEKMGFVFQGFNLINEMTVLDNVALPLVYKKMGKTKRLKKASEMLGRFHLQEREYYMPYQLSGGQQQRVAIARALVTESEILLADEPTGNLDSKTAHIVMEELRELNKAGKTIIMVTHNAELTGYATRVIKMLDGQIVEDSKDDKGLGQAISLNKGNKATVKSENLKKTKKDVKKNTKKSSKKVAKKVGIKTAKKGAK